MVLTVFAGIAEFERALIHERTGNGRAAAMRRGVRFGRPAKLGSEQVTLARRLLEEGTSAGERGGADEGPSRHPLPGPRHRAVIRVNARSSGSVAPRRACICYDDAAIASNEGIGGWMRHGGSGCASAPTPSGCVKAAPTARPSSSG
jgi:hypothetical protein